jgi:hypothetical protein
MRLTLRTLLAWLDHILLPEEQKELGDKVIGSTASQRLLERIRKVIEWPTISAPRIDAKGLAADFVLFDLDVPWRIDAKALQSKSKNSAFDGRLVQGRAVRTVAAGIPIFVAN